MNLNWELKGQALWCKWFIIGCSLQGLIFFCWVDILYCSDSVTNGDNSLVQVDFDDVMGVYSVKFSPKQQNLVVGCGNGAIQVNK